MTEAKSQIQNTKYKIYSFKDLEVWKQAHKLILLIYKTTSSFPRFELYSLADQIRRAAVSVTSNIAEGFSRNSKTEKIRFYTISLGSLFEIHNQILIAHDLKYINQASFDNLETQIESVKRLIYGIMKSAKSR